MSTAFSGYKRRVARILEKAGAEIGDVIQITRENDVIEGILIPRSGSNDAKHVTVKLSNGYNIGVRITPKTKIKKVGTGPKPAFTRPPLPKQSMDLPKVVIVSTGGTISSRVDYRTGGVRPALTANDLYSVVPELSEIAVVDTDVISNLFSENVTVKHWRKMAAVIAKHIKKGLAGIVVAHGTDTMGYSAAALSFALQNLPVPVIVVGSQRSADRPSSDAATNLIGAVRAAAYAPFAEVAVAMHETASDETIIFHRGTKTRKCHTSRRDAFRSINTSPLARMKNGQIEMLLESYRKRGAYSKLILKPNFNEKVALIKFHPSIDPNIIEWYVSESYKGIILEGTGLGHVGRYCFSKIRDAIKNNIVVGMTSQCLWGRISMNVYNQGRDLLALGVIPLDDMLPETALVKLMWILGQTDDVEEAKSLLSMNLADEFSRRTRIGETA